MKAIKGAYNIFDEKTSTLLLILILAAIFLPFNHASAAAKAGIKPGSIFYFFDTAFERINLFFIFNPEKKAQKNLEYADERLAEAEAVANEKNTDAVKIAVAGYENNMASVAEESKQVKDKIKTEELLNSIADNTSKHQEVLADVLSRVPDEAKEAITKAIEASKKGQEEAMQQIAELKQEVKELKQEIETLKQKLEQNKKSKEIKEPEIKPQLPSSRAPEPKQQEDSALKIAKCQAIYDSKIANIERAVDEQIVIVLNDLGELYKINNYPSDITRLQQKRKELLNKALLSASYTDSDGNTLTYSQRESLQRQIAAELEPEIQAVEKEILEKQGYLNYLNNVAIPELERTGKIELKRTYLDEHYKCLNQ